MTDRSGLLRYLLKLEPTETMVRLGGFSRPEKEEFRQHWRLWARREQLPPPGDWRIWMICAGRGFGKTRAGAEWVRAVAKHDPDARIALVGSSISEVRAVMVEGESGLLAISPPDRTPHFEPSLKRLTWPNGAQAFLYSAAEPEGLRGPQHSAAWCDEIGKWENASQRAISAWDNLLMGMRLGEDPRILATTTPRAVPLVRRLLAEADAGDVIVSRGSTYDNATNLPERFVRQMKRSFGKTALGRQELDGEILADVEGALWTRALLERCRETGLPEASARIVIGVDPPASAKGDACGIIVTGIGDSGVATVLADASVQKASPEKWARKVSCCRSEGIKMCLTSFHLAVSRLSFSQAEISVESLLACSCQYFSQKGTFSCPNDRIVVIMNKHKVTSDFIFELLSID